MIGIRICGTGSYLPDNVVTNEAFTAFLDTSDEWIRTRTGIVSRHIADSDTTWSMGAKAAQRALTDANCAPEEIDLLLATSVTPDYYTPSISCVVQGEIGVKNAACIDLNCACAGFVYALDMARRYLACDDVNKVLIVSSERLSGISDYEDRSTCVLFGDGAGACVVEAADTPYAFDMGADGTGAHLMFGRHVLHRSPFSKAPFVPNKILENPSKDHVLYMDGHKVYKFATQAMPLSVENACKKAGLSPEALDWIIPHQANVRIVQTAMKRLGLPMEKAWLSIDHCGNTSSASIPMALDELAHSGKLHRGQTIAVTGFGAGLTYAGAVFAY
ncbi:MAG: ketoacyl-ACP synthase III [Anaerotruncus sp.]|nr:ketoacyl-ACP synthase III [Anaerotruncus sp.]